MRNWILGGTFFVLGLIPSVSAGAIDLSLVSACVSLSKEQPVTLTSLESHSLVQKMSQGMSPEIQFTPKEWIRAALNQTADSRFSWEKVRGQGEKFEKFVGQFQKRIPTLIEQGLKKILPYLGVKVAPQDIQVNLVCGGAWDAYVLDLKGPEIFFDLGFIVESMDEIDFFLKFESLFYHELWHVVFRKHHLSHWKKSYKDSHDIRDEFFFEFVNEGMGHYFSMSHRLYPVNSYRDFDQRSKTIFELAEKKYYLMVNQKKRRSARDYLWKSHAGSKFWEKWGAVSAAIAFYHLNSVLKPAEIGALLKRDPYEVVIRYHELSRNRVHWPKLPRAMAEDAIRLSDKLLRSAP